MNKRQLDASYWAHVKDDLERAGFSKSEVRKRIGEHRRYCRKNPDPIGYELVTRNDNPARLRRELKRWLPVSVIPKGRVAVEEPAWELSKQVAYEGSGQWLFIGGKWPDLKSGIGVPPGRDEKETIRLCKQALRQHCVEIRKWYERTT